MSRGAAFPPAQGVLSQLPIPSRLLESTAPRGGQDRVARGRVVPARGVPRHQSLLAVQERGQVLQRSWHGRAVDQGGQERGEADEALLPHIPGQPDTASALRVGLQPGQLPATAGAAETGTTLVADDAAGEAHLNWCERDAALQVRDIPTGRGGGHAKLVRRDSRPHRTVGDSAAGDHGWGVTLEMFKW